MGGSHIQQTNEEKDLGILVDKSLKFQKHINAQVLKANRMLGLIKRSFSYMDKEMFLTLYKSLVRPHLEYGSTVWSIIHKKEAITLANVQRRATKLVISLHSLSYRDRLKALGLPFKNQRN